LDVTALSKYQYMTFKMAFQMISYLRCDSFVKLYIYDLWKWPFKWFLTLDVTALSYYKHLTFEIVFQVVS